MPQSAVLDLVKDLVARPSVTPEDDDCQQVLAQRLARSGFASDTLGEAAFLSALVAETGCGLLLDVNNVYVNACNHGIDATAYLDALPRHAIRQIHLAGHGEDALGSGLLIDTHDAPVCDAVWALYAHARMRFGEAGAKRRALAEPPRMPQHGHRQAVQAVDGAIVGTVVDHDHPGTMPQRLLDHRADP